MAFTRDEMKQGTIAELEAFAELIGALSPDDLARPTRCEGWTVSDVASHAIGTVVYVTEGRLEELSDPDHTQRQADERRGRTPDELAEELSAALPTAQAMLDAFPDDAWDQPVGDGLDATLYEGVEALWYDTYVHADDIRDALDRPTERTDGLRCAVQHVSTVLESMNWGPATLKLEGFDRIEIGGGGDTVTGDPHQFVLAATGRDSDFEGVPNIYAGG